MVNIYKIGSACIFNDKGEIDYSTLQVRANQLERYDSLILVVSGAIALGKKSEKEKRSNSILDAEELQGYASRGQFELMQLYDSLFYRKVAQVLVTNNDLKDKIKVKGLLEENARKNRISLINYNDGVDFEQLRKDNDTLAARIALYIGSDKLTILGKYDGFLDPEGNLIKRIYEVTDKHYEWCKGVSYHGNGGFSTKLDAAKMLLAEGKEMIISNISSSIDSIIAGDAPQTRFARK